MDNEKMTECKEKGCRYLQTTCVTCGQIVCEKTLPSIPEWISVKDRLPEEDLDVLVWDGNLNVDGIPTYEIAAYRNYKQGSFFISGSYILSAISHWIPLPLPPRNSDE